MQKGADGFGAYLGINAPLKLGFFPQFHPFLCILRVQMLPKNNLPSGEEAGAEP